MALGRLLNSRNAILHLSAWLQGPIVYNSHIINFPGPHSFAKCDKGVRRARGNTCARSWRELLQLAEDSPVDSCRERASKRQSPALTQRSRKNKRAQNSPSTASPPEEPITNSKLRQTTRCMRNYKRA